MAEEAISTAERVILCGWASGPKDGTPPWNSLHQCTNVTEIRAGHGARCRSR
jgi:hypothetical protein